MGRRRAERPLLPPGLAGALWTRKQIDAILAELALPASTPPSVIVAETLGDVGNLADRSAEISVMCGSCAPRR